MSTRVLLLDRDGVLNRDRPDYVRTPEQLELFAETPKALEKLHRAGFLVILITNQACVGKGLVTLETLHAIHARLRNLLPDPTWIDAIYYCPHTPDDKCDCRKPEPGLILRAQREWRFDPADTWMVGDAVRDIQAARAAGCRAALVRTGKGVDSAVELPEVRVFDHLHAFVNFLIDKQ